MDLPSHFKHHLTPTPKMDKRQFSGKCRQRSPKDAQKGVQGGNCQVEGEQLGLGGRGVHRTDPERTELERETERGEERRETDQTEDRETDGERRGERRRGERWRGERDQTGREERRKERRRLRHESEEGREPALGRPAPFAYSADH